MIKQITNILRWDGIFKFSKASHYIFEKFLINIKVNLVTSVDSSDFCKSMDILSVFPSSKMFAVNSNVKGKSNAKKLIKLSIIVKQNSFEEFFSIFSLLMKFGKDQNIFTSVNETKNTYSFYFYNINEISVFNELSSDLSKWSQPIAITFYVNPIFKNTFKVYLYNYITYYRSKHKIKDEKSV